MSAGAAGSFSNNNGAHNVNSWLVTPMISIPDSTDYRIDLSWWVRTNSPSWGEDQYSVLVSTIGNQLANFDPVEDEVFNEQFTEFGTNWVRKSIRLADFYGQNIWIAFRHHSPGPMGNFLAIDDVLLTSSPLFNQDLAVISFTIPPVLTFGQVPTITLEVENIGLDTVSGATAMRRNTAGDVV
jgi:hypothetical protein